MADLLWGEAIAEVRRALDDRTVADLPRDTVENWLIKTYLHLTQPSVYMHPELFNVENVTLVAATNEYVLDPTPLQPREIYLVIGVRNTKADQEYLLRPRNRRWFRQRQQAIEGRPNDYMHISTLTVPNVLRIYPTPSTEYVGDILEVEEYVEPYTVGLATDDDQAIPMQDQWHEPWVQGAIWRGWRELNQPVFADRALVDYAALVNEIKDRARIEGIEDPRTFDIDLARNRVQRF